MWAAAIMWGTSGWGGVRTYLGENPKFLNETAAWAAAACTVQYSMPLFPTITTTTSDQELSFDSKIYGILFIIDEDISPWKKQQGLRW